MQDAVVRQPAQSERLERLRGQLEPLGARTFLVSNPVTVAYATGFESSNVAVLVGLDRAIVLTDGRYVEAARGLEGVDVV